MLSTEFSYLQVAFYVHVLEKCMGFCLPDGVEMVHEKHKSNIVLQTMGTGKLQNQI